MEHLQTPTGKMKLSGLKVLVVLLFQGNFCTLLYDLAGFIDVAMTI